RPVIHREARQNFPSQAPQKFVLAEPFLLLDPGQTAHLPRRDRYGARGRCAIGRGHVNPALRRKGLPPLQRGAASARTIKSETRSKTVSASSVVVSTTVAPGAAINGAARRSVSRASRSFRSCRTSCNIAVAPC